jgi:hypothetical protein
MNSDDIAAVYPLARTGNPQPLDSSSGGGEDRGAEVQQRALRTRTRSAMTNRPPFSMQLDTCDGSTVVVLDGEIDAFTAPGLLESLEKSFLLEQ